MIGYCPQHGYVDDETSGNCFCGRDLREVLEETRRVRLSKLMSGALRHFPHDLGIELDRNGWVELASLVDAVEGRYGWAGREEVVAVVGTDPKGRFEIDDGGEEGDTRVRATYGHSVDVDVGDDALDPDEAPDALYHGTAPDKVDPILDEGILPMGRNRVHLSPSVDEARKVGKRHVDSPDSEPVVLRVDVPSLIDDGFRVERRSDTVYTVSEVPPEYVGVAPE